jgi:DNA excision repair protein ERCC-4
MIRAGSIATSGASADGLHLDISLPVDSDEFQIIDFTGLSGSEFDTHYGLLAPEQTVLVRAYTDDTDDRVLSEIQPRFIIMFEPNMEFIRRIEASGKSDRSGWSSG